MRITDTMHKDYKGRYYKYVYANGKHHVEYLNDSEIKAEYRKKWEIRNHHESNIVRYARYENTASVTDRADGMLNISMASIMDAYNDYKMSLEW